MAKFSNSRINQSDRILMYTGSIKKLPEEMVKAAVEDPELEEAILAAAVALSYTKRSRMIGQEMIDMVNNPKA